MPDRDWPPTQRRLARLLRTVAYTLAAAAGAAVLLDPPRVAEAHPAWALVLAWMATGPGVVAATGAAIHRWKVEWVAVWFVATAYLGYGILAGVAGDEGLAAALQLSAVLLSTRGVDLWVFSLQLSRARTARVRAWRREAGLAP